MDFTVGKENHALWLLPTLAMQYVNLPYIFGGKNALIGLDCSGLVCELLQAIGAIGTSEEYGSQALYDKFKDKSVVGEICLGSLSFYGKSDKEIDHVAMFLDTHFVIEAGHGTAQTKTLEDAKQRGAMGRVRPFNYRKDLVSVIRPRYEDMGIHD